MRCRKLLQRLLFACALIAPLSVWAASDQCSIVAIGTPVISSSGNSVTPTLPVTPNPGELIMINAFETLFNDATTVPSGYNVIKQGPGTNWNFIGKIATASEGNPTVTWATSGQPKAAYIIIVRNPGGFPVITSILGNSSTGQSGATTGFNYRALTITQGYGCAFNFGYKLIGVAGGTATGVSLTPTYVTAGTAISTNAFILAGQMDNDGVDDNITGTAETVTGNTTSDVTVETAFTLLSGDVDPTGFTFSPLINQPPTSTVVGSPVTLGGLTNYAPLIVVGGSDPGCGFQVDANAFSSGTQYVQTASAITPRVTSKATGLTANCTGQVGNVRQSTFSVTSTAADSVAPTCSMGPISAGATTTTLSVSAACADETDANVTDYIAAYADGTTPAPTPAQVAAVSGTGVIAGSGASATVANGVTQTLTTPAVEVANTPYDVYFTTKDATGNYKAVTKLDISTIASVSSLIPVVDTFTGTNGTAIASHTPNRDIVAGGWAKVAIDASAVGNAVIQSNAAAIDDHTGVVISVGNPDMVFKTDWNTKAGISNEIRLITRYIDANNHNFCGCGDDSNGGHCYAVTVVGGTFSYGSPSATSLSLVDGTTYSVTAGNVGGQLVCSVNGALKVARATTANSAGIKGGLGTATGTGVAQTYDNIQASAGLSAFATATGRVADDPLGVYFNETPAAGSFWWWDTLPAHGTVTARNGGSWKWVNDGTAENFGAAVFGYNPTSNAIEPATVQVNVTGATVAPAWNTPQSVTWPIGVNSTTDLTQFMTNRGSPQATCSVQSGTLAAGMTLGSANCGITGTPTTPAQGGSSAVVIRATGSATADLTLNQTISGDSVPDASSVAFVDQTTLNTTTLTACPAITPTGINIPMQVQRGASPDPNCEFQIDAGAFGTASQYFIPGTNTTITAHVMSGAIGDTKHCPMNFGGVLDSCDVSVTPVADTQPDPFSIPPQSGVPLGATVESCFAITGFDTPAAITATDGSATNATCTIGQSAGAGGTPSASCGNSVPPSTLVCAQHKASLLPNTPASSQICVGGQCANFTSTTRGAGPQCGDIPILNYVAGASGSYDVSPFCQGVTSWTGPGGAPFAGASVNGSVITYSNAPLGDHPVTMVASNSNGSRNVNVLFRFGAAGGGGTCTGSGAVGCAVRNTIWGH
jgi:hypothetical protein